jgi:glycosyltransferase involved in cell wall biosynthesis/putative flippase GtrA
MSVINLLLFVVALKWLHINYIVSNIATYLIVVVISFFINRKVVFGGADKENTHRQLMIYILMRCCVIVADTSLLFLLVDILRTWMPLAKIIVMTVMTFASYGFSRLIMSDKPCQSEPFNEATGNKKILAVINYYYPYISGVSENARIVSQELVKHGYDVTVITSNYAELSEREIINGVKVIRTPVQLRISKGVISLKFISAVIKAAKTYDAVMLYIPMLEAGLFSLLIDPHKLLIHVGCEIYLQPGLINTIIQKAMDISTYVCGKRAKAIFVGTIDYASQSRVVRKFYRKFIEVPPLCKPYAPDKAVDKYNRDKKFIGFCGRLVEEKGLFVLLEAYKIIKEKREDIELLVGGDYEGVAGGSVHKEMIELIKMRNIRGVRFLGKIDELNMARFYTYIDVLALPSINTMESFGMVQIEAMRCGTPVVASDLPGVRTIVKATGMGVISRICDAEDLAKCLLEVIDNPEKYVKPPETIERVYSIDKIFSKYEETLKLK